jgi:hypothetical protein
MNVKDEVDYHCLGLTSMQSKYLTQVLTSMIGAKHVHTATATFASRYREIEKIKVRMKHKQTKDMWHE